MASSTTKFAIIACIMLVTMDSINCQILAIGPGFDKTNSLLENVNNTSTTMMSTMQQLAMTQVQMSQTDSSILNKLNEIGETQSEMSQTETNILNKLNEIGETQNQMAKSFNQVVTFLQMQSQQLQNLAELMANQVNVQNQPWLQNVPPYDCLNLTSKGNYPSGVYTIKPSGCSDFTADVYCDMVTEGGGWTIFQRRFNGEVDFNRNWTEYEQGFGDVDGEYWAGLRLLHLFTLSRAVTLRVELSSFDNEIAYAEYRSFSVGDLSSNYTLTIGSYSGNAGDSLAYHNNMQFTTNDRDNDHNSGNCAQYYQGAWWYKSCHRSLLNGQYLGPTGNSESAMVWRGWKGWQSLKSSKMMLRRNQ